MGTHRHLPIHLLLKPAVDGPSIVSVYDVIFHFEDALLGTLQVSIKGKQQKYAGMLCDPLRMLVDDIIHAICPILNLCRRSKMANQPSPTRFAIFYQAKHLGRYVRACHIHSTAGDQYTTTVAYTQRQQGKEARVLEAHFEVSLAGQLFPKAEQDGMAARIIGTVLHLPNQIQRSIAIISRLAGTVQRAYVELGSLCPLDHWGAKEYKRSIGSSNSKNLARRTTLEVDGAIT